MRTRKIQCSKCGSYDIVKPVNESDWDINANRKIVIYRCAKCGHEKIETKIQNYQHTYELKKENINKPIQF